MNASLTILRDDIVMEDLFDYLCLREADRKLIARTRDVLPAQQAMFELMRRHMETKLDDAFVLLQNVYHHDFQVLTILPVGHKDLPKLVADKTRLKQQQRAVIRELIMDIRALFVRIDAL